MTGAAAAFALPGFFDFFVFFFWRWAASSASAIEGVNHSALPVIVAMEETPFLLAMQGVVGGVQIENDVRGRARVRFDEQVHEQLLDRGAVATDLVVEAGSLSTAPGGSRSTCRRRERKARLQLARQHRKQRIVPQGVVVVEILVAQRQTENPLPNRARRNAR